MSRLRLVLVAALTASLLAGGVTGVLAQSDDSVTPAAGVNADRVDGKHAVDSDAIKKHRANKLVATDEDGYLPPNILKPLWRLVQDVPAAFADGIDNGIVAMTVTQVVGAAAGVVAGGDVSATATCPAGSLPISGGFTASSYGVSFVSSFRTANGWVVAARNNADIAANITPIVYCMVTSPAGGFSIATQGGKGIRPATTERPPAPKRK